MVSFILIRHGESTDNLRQVWAGWKDSPLSNHGMRQAEALAEDFAHKNVLLSAIHTSDLSRAKTTARAVKDRQPDRNIPIHESRLLREQNFGAAEGTKICKMEKELSVTRHYAKGKFPALHTRKGTFSGGESLDDMAERANMVIDQILAPYVLKEQEDGKAKVVAVFSHGLFISELVAAIVKKDRNFKGAVDVRNMRGMSNTGWTRVELTLRMEDKANCDQVPSTPSWVVSVTGVNRTAHLSNLKGGIGSLAHDPAQQDIRAFLGGKQKTSKSTSTVKPKPY